MTHDILGRWYGNKNNAMNKTILKYSALLIGALFCYHHLTIQAKESFKGNTKNSTRFLKGPVIQCLNGDTTYMQKHSNGYYYTFKSGLEKGTYIAYYDSSFVNRALCANIKNGELHGMFYRYDKKGHLLESCKYKWGQMNGWRKLYFYEGENVYVNTEYCKDHACEPRQHEW